MNPRYQAWLKHVFDHKIKKRPWYIDHDAPQFEASPIEMTELIGQTFLCAGQDLAKYTDAKVDQGIWYLASSPESNFMSALASAKVPLRKRLKAIDSIFNLYADCFAKRCVETLGYLSEKGSPLNSSCYMFWDLCRHPGFGHPSLEEMLEGKKMRAAVLNVLEKTLTIEHRACREGALHGLGHIADACPEKVREVIDGFLSGNKLAKKLRTYALKARDGRVL